MPTLRHRLRQYPAVALAGPRQCGKTTLARMIGGAYFDIEQPDERVRLDVSWEEVTEGRSLIILDEAQTWPQLFPRLRGTIDANRRRRGRFLLLGSVAPALMREVSESLAGRLSLLELGPFALDELPRTSVNQHWLYGGYPDGGILRPSQYPAWARDYLELLTQRDLPAWGLAAKPQTTQRLIRMLAASHGQIWNASQIGQSLGLSYHTVNSYAEFLEGVFLIRRVPAWSANLGKRLVRSPRCYWRDSGLLHALLGATNLQGLLVQPWVGASWEGFCIEQILRTLTYADRRVEPHFFRTTGGQEIDLVFALEKQLWAIEFKLTTSPAPQDFEQLNATADLIGATRRALVSRVTKSTMGKDTASCSLPDLLAWLLR